MRRPSRANQQGPRFESDVWTETVAVPALTTQGVFTPRLVVFDSDLDIVPRLVTIYERVPGVSLKRVSDLTNPDAFYFEVGEAIRSFHDRVTQVDDPNNRLDPEWATDYPKALAKFEELVPESKGLLPRDLIYDSTQKVFTHQDLHPDNIMVHDGKLAAIIFGAMRDGLRRRSTSDTFRFGIWVQLFGVMVRCRRSSGRICSFIRSSSLFMRGKMVVRMGFMGIRRRKRF